MKIGGFLKLSLIDYPGKLAAVIFTQGCSMRCHFCHNPTLVIPKKFTEPVSENEVIKELLNRKKYLDGVVISGGEPTIQSGLFSFLEKIKKENFLVKLDTNGTEPKILNNLIQNNLIDYVAMDIKSPFEKYPLITGTSINIDNIKKSINILFSSNINYEFRSTLVPKLHNIEDIKKMAQSISKAPLYVLQNFIPQNTLNKELTNTESFTLAEMEDFQRISEKFVQKCQIR